MIIVKSNRFISAFIAFVALSFIISLIVFYYIVDIQNLSFNENFDFLWYGFLFVLACLICIPNLVVSLFFNDDGMWEERTISLYHTLRKIELRRYDLGQTDTGWKLDRRKFNLYWKERAGLSAIGSYVTRQKFNDLLTPIVDDVVYKCGPGNAENIGQLNNIENEVRSLIRINNIWFLSTSWFLMSWSVICIVALGISFFHMTEAYSKKLHLWYTMTDTERGFITSGDVRWYVYNASVKSFVSNILEVFDRQIADRVNLMVANSQFSKGLEYLYRTLLALSVVPGLIAAKRLLRFYFGGVRRDIAERIRLQTQL